MGRLAIEHTLVEPFVGDRRDFARFAPFLAPEADRTLLHDGRIAYVDVPRDALSTGRPIAGVAEQVHQWLRGHLLRVPEGRSTHSCPISLGGKSTVLQLQIR